MQKLALTRIAKQRELSAEILAKVEQNPEFPKELVTRKVRRRPQDFHRPFGFAPGIPEEAAATARAIANAPRLSPDEVNAILTGEREDPVLEAIILLLGRPVLLIQNDDFDPADAETDFWRGILLQHRERLRNAIKSVGRIELRGDPQFDWVGTGWVIADDIIVTNRHVAEVFARRQGDRFMFNNSPFGPIGVRIDFREEFGSQRPQEEFEIRKVLWIEPANGPDMAFLQVSWDTPAPGQRLALEISTDIDASREVAIIGYPAKDSRTNVPDEMERIFGGIYDVKRLAPGQVLQMFPNQKVFTTDCTTLGGNSGSVVLDMERGTAIGLHFAGREQLANFAVMGAAVRERLETLPITPRSGGASGSAVSTEPRGAEDLADREGYDENFLGVLVPLPQVEPAANSGGHCGHARPSSPDQGVLLHYTHFSVKMHPERRLARYSACNIDGHQLRRVPRSNTFLVDPRISVELQADNQLYRNNPLDRGHLTRRLDPVWGDPQMAKKANDDSFFYTNIAPQHASINQGVWSDLEDFVLDNTRIHDLKIAVLTGCVFRPDDRPYRGFQLPEDFWKVLALVNEDTSQLSVTGYIVSQRNLVDDIQEFVFGAFRTFQVSVRTIEEQTGLSFGDLSLFDPFRSMESLGFRARRLDHLDEIVL
jgi:endonuclease G, mitochondrial